MELISGRNIYICPGQTGLEGHQYPSGIPEVPGDLEACPSHKPLSI